MKKFKVPQEVRSVYSVLKKAGFEAYLVGGCVRDLLLEKIPKDWDITTNAKPEEIEKLYQKSFYENSFGTVSVVTDSKDKTLKNIEITPYRLESAYSDKRHPDKISFANKLEEDLKRRDFTINALALNIENEEIKDIFKGQEDIKQKLIKSVGNAEERFEEDALRIMRAVRLSVELNFKFEKKTYEALKKKKRLLEVIAKERIRDEFIKIIMSSEPKKGLEVMHELDILKYVMPELEEEINVTQNKEHIYTVWEHSIRALDHATKQNWPLDVRVASLLHDIAKPRTKHGEGVNSTFYGHDVVGGRLAKKMLLELKFPKKFVEKISKLVRYHLFFSDTDVITLSAVRRIVKNVGRENIEDLLKVRFCDRVGMGRPKERPFRLRKYESMIEQVLRDPISVNMLKINGNKIIEITNIKPGPKIGFILSILLEEVLDDPKLNSEEYLEKKTKELSFLADKELASIGIKARQKSTMLEKEEVDKIKKKYFVK